MTNEERISEIIRLYNLGHSQNQICSMMRLSKSTVNQVLRRYQDGISGLDTGTSGGIVPVQRPVHQSDSGAESFYLNKRISDLTGYLDETRKKLSDTQTELEKVTRERNAFDVDLKTINERHKIELERLQNALDTKGTGGLNGIIDKIMDNDKLSAPIGLAIGEILKQKILGAGASTVLTGPQNSTHEDPEVSKMIREINEGLAHYDKERLTKLHDMIGMFLIPELPGLLETTYNQLVQYAQAKLNSQS